MRIDFLPIAASSLVYLSGLVVLSSCKSCEEAEPERRTGSVSQASAYSTMRPVTEDGYEVIEATPAARRRQQQKRAEEDRGIEHLALEPTEPDPHNGSFTIEEAVEGLGTDGTLIAEINTTFGTVLCDLYTEETPNTVANFVGLARGRRQWWDARAGQWRRRPYYNDTRFHRVVPGYLIQGGDYLNGRDGPIGYTIDDEPHDELSHNRAGQLCMASTGVNENAAQFFITDGPAPQLDEDTQFTIFGQWPKPRRHLSDCSRPPERRRAHDTGGNSRHSSASSAWRSRPSQGHSAARTGRLRSGDKPVRSHGSARGRHSRGGGPGSVPSRTWACSRGHPARHHSHRSTSPDKSPLAAVC